MPFGPGGLKMTPPRLTPLIGRASPAGSKNFGGLNKGVDMPNKTRASTGDMAPLPSKMGSNAPYKHEIPTSFGPNKDFMA